MYTSGWPKNQKRCWYNIGSPPPFASKNEVLKFLSASNIVIAPAKTGSERSNKKAVIKTDQTNSGVRFAVIPGARMLVMVTMKFIAPRIDEIPAKCNE
jgi:hypothetical protein